MKKNAAPTYKSILAVALLIVLSGCAHSYEMRSSGGKAPSAKLSRDASIYVGLPKDGRYGSHVYVGSGVLTTHEIVQALSVYTKTVKAASSVSSREENLAAARSTSAQYLLQATILHWEDRATEWSGLSDQMSIRLELINVATGKSMDSSVISGKSKFWTFGGDHPEHLLPVPLGNYAKSLFAPK